MSTYILSKVGGAQVEAMINYYIKKVSIKWVFLPVDCTSSYTAIPSFYNCISLKHIAKMASSGIHYVPLSRDEATRKVSVMRCYYNLTKGDNYLVIAVKFFLVAMDHKDPTQWSLFRDNTCRDIAYVVFGNEPYSGLRGSGDSNCSLLFQNVDPIVHAKGVYTTGDCFIPASVVTAELQMTQNVRDHFSTTPETTFRYNAAPQARDGVKHEFDEYCYSDGNASKKLPSSKGGNLASATANFDLIQLNETLTLPPIIR